MSVIVGKNYHNLEGFLNLFVKKKFERSSHKEMMCFDRKINNPTGKQHITS
jgi:hypothetical protein